MKKKRLVGIITLAVLLILGSLEQIINWTSINSYRMLARQLPESFIIFRFFAAKFFIVIGLITGVGLLFRKNAYRIIAIFIGVYLSVYYYLIEGPLSIKNLISYGVKIDLAIIMKMLGEFTFGLCLIYYLTRPKVKEMFR